MREHGQRGIEVRARADVEAVQSGADRRVGEPGGDQAQDLLVVLAEAVVVVLVIRVGGEVVPRELRVAGRNGRFRGLSCGRHKGIPGFEDRQTDAASAMVGPGDSRFAIVVIEPR
jgi:hypothetical protein